MKMRSGLLSGIVVAALCCGPAFGWGADGHRIVAAVAVKALPAEIPAFLRTPVAAERVGYLAPEPDREKGAGDTRDREYDPGHFLDANDDLTVFGGPRLAMLPATREDYDSFLRASGHTQYLAGYLPYSIVSGYQLLVRDFALWRAYDAGARFAKTDAARAGMQKIRAWREEILVHDLGVWSHFVGDGSQPLHVTVHYNGWGNYPNPEGFTQEKVHGPWESGYVHANVGEGAVAAALPALNVLSAPIMQQTADYLAGTEGQVVPFYRLEKQGAFAAPTAAGTAFTVAQLARGAGELRDLIVAAWRTSASAKGGWPEVPVSDIEAGKAEPPPPFGN
jgi:hypothetical protein